MTQGASKKDDPGAPPSYAAVVAQGTSQQVSGSSRTQIHAPQRYHPEIGGDSSRAQLPFLDPRSQAAQEAARSRALLRFFEAFLWAVVIYAIAAAIVGSSVWPTAHRRHWLKE